MNLYKTEEKYLKTVKSAFIFNEYIVKNVVFEVNDDVQTSNQIELDLKLETDFYLNDEKDQAMVMLQCIIFDDYKDKQFPFYLNVELVGNFFLDGDFTNDEVIDLCRVNATAVLFPYLRAFVSNLTALSGVPNLILPTININKLLEKSSS